MRAVVLSGGPTHDFPATTARLSALVEGAGAAVEVHADVDAAFAALPGAGLLVVNALRWTMTCAGTPSRYRDRAAAEGVSASATSRAALGAHLAAGGGVLAVHTAALCFDDWAGWADALGGAWVWGRSGHPPVGPVDVDVDVRHPLTDGVDGFRLVDEVYSDLWRAPDVVALAGATVPGTDRPAEPVLWAREHGGGRIVYDALGHHPPSYDVPERREILRRAVRWTTGG